MHNYFSMRKLLVTACLLVPILLSAQEALWLRYPSISPDGTSIVFGYKGNLYKVAATGGDATPLTVGESHSMMPIWSRDGQSIAFANNRHGNFDVFVMPANGGQATRLTYNSADDYPYDFTADNASVYFGSARQAPAASVRFPSIRLFQNVYQVPTNGGRAKLVSAAGMDHAKLSPNGKQLVFQDRKGYEDAWRKHHTSSVTRDIWIYDLAKKNYLALTNEEIEHREPVFAQDGQSVFYLSEKDGTLNVYKKGLQGSNTQLTRFTKNPVRHLSISKNNTLAFTQDGAIYTLAEGGTPNKISVRINTDSGLPDVKNLPLSGDTREFKLSPDGKQIAYITRGELFVTSVEGDFTKRITETAGQERMLDWAPDSKTLIYAAERDSTGWGIYKTEIAKANEPYFFNASLLKESPVLVNSHNNFAPKYSPDGKSIAFIEDRNILKVMPAAGGKAITLLPEGRNHSYADGDWGFEWSPDSRWLFVDDQRGFFLSGNTALVKADGTGELRHPILSGFGDGGAKWSQDGKIMTWESSRYGRKSLAFQGSREVDVFAAFFDQEAYDHFQLNKDEFKLLEEREKQDSTKKKTPAPEFVPNIENLRDRTVRLTINSSSISDYVMNKDLSKLFYLAAFEKGYDLWVTEPRTRETKILAKLGGSPSGLEISKDGKSLFMTNRGSLVKVDAESGKVTPISSKSEISLDAAAEREYMFHHAWLQVEKKFYDPKLHGIDWKGYKNTYARFLPHINNNYDFQELLSELLGELNASHTGGRYSPRPSNPDITPSLGLLYDELYTGDGLRITEVLAGGPLDKANSKIDKGSTITEIDGKPLNANEDWAKQFNRKAGQYVHISGKTASGADFSENIKPISQGEENGLMYKRWIKSRQAYVDKISNGQIGYVHIEGMNDGSFRELYERAMGENADKKALVVDTRFNGGGWLHDDLNTFLSGKQYLQFAPQGNIVKGGEPASRWNKPSIVVMSEGNYSDAHIFPYIYKQNGLGKLVGMPVPGTGTAVWWESQIDPTIVFGIPMIGTIGKEGRTTENMQVEPDIRVPLPYEAFLNGEDPQLKTAVEEMMKEVK